MATSKGTLISKGGRAGMVMMGGHYAYIAAEAGAEGNKLVFARAYDGADGEVKEEMRELASLPKELEEVSLSFTMTKGESGPVFRMFYSADGTRQISVETDFTPSDHTWVGAKIGLFATTDRAQGQAGYGEFAYIHVTALEE